MKLYNVPKNTRISINFGWGEVKELDFHHIDGLYSYCEDDIGSIYHISADANVEIVLDKNKKA